MTKDVYDYKTFFSDLLLFNTRISDSSLFYDLSSVSIALCLPLSEAPLSLYYPMVISGEQMLMLILGKSYVGSAF